MLDPLEPVIRGLLDEWPEIKAPRVTELLRDEHGYGGSVDLVRKRLAAIRPRSERPAQRTGYRPAQVMQVDWAEMPTRPKICGRERRVYALICSLPYSGASTAHFSFEMTVESFIEGHVHAFEWLGGVPRECVYDNLRSAVARREGDQIGWNERFPQLRGHYAFHATACTPETPREKGSVEGAVRYMKTGFWPARRFGSLAELDANTPTGAIGSPTAASTQAVASRSPSGSRSSARRQGRCRPRRFDFAYRRSSRVPLDGYLQASAAPTTGRRSRSSTSGSSCAPTATGSGSTHRGRPVAHYERSYEPGQLEPAAGDAPRAAAAARACGDRGARGHPAGARRLRRALRMSAAKAKAGERLPYLLSKLKTPRVARAPRRDGEHRTRAEVEL